MSCAVVLGAIFLCLAMLLSPCQAGYVVDVEPKDEECFSIPAPKIAGTIYGNYEILAGTRDAVSFMIVDAKDERVKFRSRRGSGDGSFKVKQEQGQKMIICLQNGVYSNHRGEKVSQIKQHDGLSRTIGLSFSFEEEDAHKELHSQNSRILDQVNDLKSHFFRLKDHQGYMRVRESMHRQLVEKTFSRLMGWNLLEAGALVAVALGQILYLRRFLEQRRYM